MHTGQVEYGLLELRAHRYRELPRLARLLRRVAQEPPDELDADQVLVAPPHAAHIRKSTPHFAICRHGKGQRPRRVHHE